MTTITIRETGKKYQWEKGSNLLENLEKEGLFLSAVCGGKGKCGKCRFMIIEGGLSEITVVEKVHLSDLELDRGIRLACQTKIIEDAIISLPDLTKIKNKEITKSRTVSEKSSLYVRNCGCAVDVGTTTVGIYLINLTNGEIIDQTSFLNPQMVFGHDVISRLSAGTDRKKRRRMQIILRDKIQSEVISLCENNSIPLGYLSSVHLVGNTPITHLLTGEDFTSLARLPFCSSFENRGHIPIPKSLFKFHETCSIYFLAVPGGYIGSDILAGITAVRLYKEKEPCMLLDLGTNGEIVLGYGGEICAASTAAGPAFEGAHLKSGIIAVPGAICNVTYDNNSFHFETIDDLPPTGICGSGILSLLKVTIDNEIVNPSGMFNPNFSGIRKGEYDKIVIASDANGEEIVLTQNDIREVQLAKAAVATGIEFLLKQFSLNIKNIKNIFLTGAFGNTVNLDDLVAIGILPEGSIDKVSFIDNAAGRGAILTLLDDDLFKLSELLAQQIKTINLGESPDFQSNFIKHFAFKPYQIE